MYKSRGFTLIEIMIVVAIVGVLAAVALPSYLENLRRGDRAAARSTLLLAGQYMHKFYSANDSYQTDRGGNNLTVSAMPTTITQTSSSGNVYYELDISTSPCSLTGASFTICFKPVNKMAGDKCGIYTLDHTGAKGIWVGGSAGSAALRDECWK